MKEQWSECFYLYLDGRGTEVERKQVETLLAENPQAREVWEETKSLYTHIQNSKPLELKAPAEFRGQIMQRLRAQPTGSGKGPGSGSGKVWLHKTTSWWVSGIVLTALVGSMVYIDHEKRIQVPREEADRVKADISVGTEENALLELPTSTAFQQGVAPDSILSPTEKNQNIQEASVLTGEVYSRGTVSKTNSSQMIDSLEKRALQDVRPQVASRLLGLERSTDWTQARIERALQRAGQQQGDSAEQVLVLARKYNLNPGLIIAARQTFPTKNLDTLADTMRKQLNRSQGQSEDQQLLGLLKAFKTDAVKLDQWKQLLSQE